MRISNFVIGLGFLTASITLAGPMYDRVEVGLTILSHHQITRYCSPGNTIRQHESTAGEPDRAHFSDDGMKLETTAMGFGARQPHTGTYQSGPQSHWRRLTTE